MPPKTFWQSVLESKKAIISGLAAFVAFVGATLNAAPSHHLTLAEWAVAVGLWAGTHVGVYVASNEDPAPKVEAGPELELPPVGKHAAPEVG